MICPICAIYLQQYTVQEYLSLQTEEINHPVRHTYTPYIYTCGRCRLLEARASPSCIAGWVHSNGKHEFDIINTSYQKLHEFEALTKECTARNSWGLRSVGLPAVTVTVVYYSVTVALLLYTDWGDESCTYYYCIIVLDMVHRKFILQSQMSLYLRPKWYIKHAAPYYHRTTISGNAMFVRVFILIHKLSLHFRTAWYMLQARENAMYGMC